MFDMILAGREPGAGTGQALQPRNGCTDDELIDGIDEQRRAVAAAERDLFRFIAEADRRAVWRGSGCRDMAEWLAGRCHISTWKAHRWIRAAHALERLPVTSRAWRSGALGVDKVVELARFATARTEAGLVAWANRVRPATVRRRADRAEPPPLEETRQLDGARHLFWWFFDDEQRFALGARRRGGRCRPGHGRGARRPRRPRGRARGM